VNYVVIIMLPSNSSFDRSYLLSLYHQPVHRYAVYRLYGRIDSRVFFAYIHRRLILLNNDISMTPHERDVVMPILVDYDPVKKASRRSTHQIKVTSHTP
jgi:hypothetical protein